MKIEISMLVTKTVDPAFIKFVNSVSEGEELSEWQLDIWSCDGEGICEGNRKRIRMGICSNVFRTKCLFLHEVAHAIHPGARKTKEWDNSYWHRKSWQEIFARLLIDYLPDWWNRY